MSTRRLHDYQVRLADLLEANIKAGERKMLLSSPTGSGKSLVITALAARLKDHEVVQGPRIIVGCPQSHIRQSFGFAGALRDGHRRTDTRVLCEVGASARTTDQLLRRLRGEGDCFMYATTHSSLAGPRSLALVRTIDTKGRLLVLDEGHHSSLVRDINRLSELRDAWLAGGGSVLLVTATPFRADGSPVVDDTWIRVTRSVAEHCISGLYAPKHLRCEYRFLPASSGVVDLVPTKQHAEAIAQQWANDAVAGVDAEARPKAVVIVPQLGASKWCRHLTRALAGVGARVFDATGATPAKRAEVRRVLAVEGDVTRWTDSNLDVVIACKRFDEGTDWPLCSHVYVIGHPASLGLALQRWGRATRNKLSIEGHPFSSVATVAFYGIAHSSDLDASLSTFGRLSIYRETAHLLAAHAHDWDLAQKFVRANQELWSTQRDGESMRSTVVLDEAEQAQALVDIDRAIARLGLQHADTLDAEQVRTVVEQVERRAGASRASVVAQVLFERGKTKDKVAALSRAIEQIRGRPRSLIRSDMRAQFHAALRELDFTYSDPSASERLAGVMQWTGEDIVQLCNRLSKARETRTREGFARWVREYIEATGNVPKATEGIDWAQWANRNGSTFTAEIEALGYMPVRQLNQGRTLKQVIANVRAHAEKHGTAPQKCASKEWKAVDTWLTRVHGKTLAALVVQLKLEQPTRSAALSRAALRKAETAKPRSLRWWAAKRRLTLDAVAKLLTNVPANALAKPQCLGSKRRVAVAQALGVQVGQIEWT